MPEFKQIATNRKAKHNYSIQETLEAGIQLLGAEVKSIRASHVSIKEAYVRIDKGEAYLINAHIKPYEHACNRETLDPYRKRKLLLHKKQIASLIGKNTIKGMALIPLSVYFNEKGKVKLQIGLGKGKKQHDKRESIKKKSQEREMKKALRKKQKM